MTKRLLVFSILALLLVAAVTADPSEAGALLERLAEEGKLPENADWSESISEALAAETAESGTLHPLTLSIIADSIPVLSENEDPTAAVDVIAEAMRRVGRQIRRGIAQTRIRQETRRNLDRINGINGQAAADIASGRPNRGRGTARGILESLDNPGSGNIPFSSIPGIESGDGTIPGQGAAPVPEGREKPEDSGNEGNDHRPDPPF